MGARYWQPEESKVLLDNPNMTARELAVLVAALGFRECDHLDIKARRRRLKMPAKERQKGWTGERVKQLKVHWDAKKSPAEIAVLMPDYSRAAILSKGVRMGWPRHDWGPPKTPKQKPSKAAAAFRHGSGCVSSPEPLPPQPVKCKGPTARSLNIYMRDARFTSSGCCKYSTMTDEGGPRFCCAPTDGTYCREHVADLRQPDQKKPPSAPKSSQRVAPPEDDGEPKPLDFEKAA